MFLIYYHVCGVGLFYIPDVHRWFQMLGLVLGTVNISRPVCISVKRDLKCLGTHTLIDKFEGYVGVYFFQAHTPVITLEPIWV